jgi:transcriptional regulator with XRE-family HTH domain
MGGRVTDLIVIPDSFWLRPETTAALRDRDIGRLFALLRQYAGASQTQIAIACGMTQSKVSYIMRGIAQVEALAVFERIAYGLGLPDPARMLIGLAPGEPPAPAAPGRAQREAILPGDDDPGLTAFPVAGLLDPYLVGEQEEAGPVRRRTFVGLTVTSMVSTMLDGLPHDHDPAGSDCFAAVLVGQPAGPAQEPDLKALAEAASSARRQYQACGYSELTRTLPQLLTDLDAACRSLDGAARSRALALCADAYHVAAGLLLKLGDQGLAHLAADRSMRAARTSGDPVTVGASARIVTHALMSGGHLAAAVWTARSHAEDLDRGARTYTPESLSVYGSLLLRGAIAAAQNGDRPAAHDLLAEADQAAQRLGADANHRWTAFGPVNAKLHRVNIAVTLGDAGTAVDVAHGTDLRAIAITERKASLLIDVARAFLQWGRHDRAYLSLRAAEQLAHEEVAGRPSVRRLVGDLATSAPPAVRRDAEQFASQIGIAR